MQLELSQFKAFGELTMFRRLVTGGPTALAAMAFAWALILFSAGTAGADAGFRAWIDNFRHVAMKSGISSRTYAHAFSGVASPDPEVLAKARYQPEFTAPVWQYMDNHVNETAVSDGERMAHKWAGWLDRIERTYGVDRDVLLAIWSMETKYGEVLDDPTVVRDVIRALATLAYADPSRSKYARKQLIAAMRILQRGDIDRSHLTGSWAGAMGHTQFIPTSYELYAVDFDGNGKRDIWRSVPDALATAANLLRKNGWEPGKTWGYEVVLPAGGKFPSGWMTLAGWRKLGVVRANGMPFPRLADKAMLKVPEGRTGPAFLMLNNFAVIKRYNNADTYAIAVGLLADRLGGYGGLSRDWNRPFTPISQGEREELQKHLQTLGYYDGDIDGLIGSGSRDAISAFQKHMGLTPDGYASKEVLSVIRNR